jgi:hypothetical protein
MIRSWSVKNTKNPPGQVRNTDKTLGDYIKRKCHHEWYNVHNSMSDAVTGRRCRLCNKQEWF